MKLSEVLCFVLPFIIVIIVLSIKKEEEEPFGTMEHPKLQINELPEEPILEEKTYGFIPSLICSITPIPGDYGCKQRDALLHEKELKRYDEELEEVNIENSENEEQYNEEIKKKSDQICKNLDCKNGSTCEVGVDETDIENKGISVISGSCACPAGFHGKDCSTVLDACTSEINCNSKGVPSTNYDIPDIGCKCDCEDGFGGDDCSTEYTQCNAVDHCNGRGETKGYDSGDGCICDCIGPWEGDDCSIKKELCTEGDCNNVGTPKKDSYKPNPDTGRLKECECDCDSAYEGQNCEKLKEIKWSESECLNDQTCQDIRANGTSRCINNFYQTVDSNQLPICNECPMGSENINPPFSKGGKRINPVLGSSTILDCICENNNEYLDKITNNCELCPENTIKSRSTNGDITDCICDTSLGWYDNPNWNPQSTDQEKCIRCGWDQNEQKLKQGFIYHITEGTDGEKIGECKCSPSYEKREIDGSDEFKCLPTGKCSTDSFKLSNEGGVDTNLNEYKQSLFREAETYGEPQNVCNGIGSKNALGKKIVELNQKDIRLSYNSNDEPILDNNGNPIFSEIGNNFINKINCNSSTGRCSCPGSATMYLKDESNTGEILPCQSCAPLRDNPTFLTYDETKDSFRCSSSECFNGKDNNTLKGLGCLNYLNDEKTREKKFKDNPLENESGPLIFKEGDNWTFYNADGVKTIIDDKLPNLCNSNSSPPKCGSKTSETDICMQTLGPNWEEKKDYQGNNRCACKIPYENRKIIDGKKTCVYDSSICDLYSQDLNCNIQDTCKDSKGEDILEQTKETCEGEGNTWKEGIYKCPLWAQKNDMWNPKDFRLWGMATINNIGIPGNDNDIQLDNDGNIIEKECEGCYIPPPIKADGQEDGNDDLSEVKNKSLFAGLPKKLSLSYMNEKGQWIHYCKPKTGESNLGYASKIHEYNALNPFTIMNDSETPLPDGKTEANPDIENAKGVCGKAQFYDFDEKKCFNIGGGCYSRGSEAGWYTEDIGDFYNLGLPACNFKSNVSLTDIDTHDNRTKAGIAKKEKIIKNPTDETNYCCQSCHYKFYSPNSSKLTDGDPKSTIYKKESFNDLKQYIFPAIYYGPTSNTPPTNHAGCIGATDENNSGKAWRGGRPFCSPGLHSQAAGWGFTGKGWEMNSTEDDHPVPTENYRGGGGPWRPEFNWNVQGVSKNCGETASEIQSKASMGSCGERNNSIDTQTPRRSTESNYLQKAEGGGYAGMTGHADVTPLNRPDPNHAKAWGANAVQYGAHGYSGDSGFGVSTENIYQKAHRVGVSSYMHTHTNAKDLFDAYKGLTNGAWDEEGKGKGRRNVIGWNNQSKYTEVTNGNKAPDDIIDESGKRNHWLAENGSTMPILHVGGTDATEIKDNNHDVCSIHGLGSGGDCSKSNRKTFDHHDFENKDAIGIGYPGIKVPSAESTKKIYSGEPGPFASIKINHATGFNSLPTDYYLHNHPIEGDGPYSPSGEHQIKKPANARFADYGDNEFDVQNKTHEQGKRYENLFYCKRSLGTANENPGSEEEGDDYKNMISGASIDRTNFMTGDYSKGNVAGNKKAYTQHGSQGQWSGTYHVIDDIVQGGKHPINSPHLYTKNLIALGKWSWPLQNDELLQNSNSIKSGISFLGGNTHAGTNAETQPAPKLTEGSYTKDTSHIPKEQIKLLGGGEAVRAIVPRELNNMAYYDKEYGGWVQKNNTYQGTYRAQKWLRPYPGSAKKPHDSIYWDRGAHPTRPNDSYVLTMGGCRNWDWAGGHGSWANGAGTMYVGKPGWKSSGGNTWYSKTSNPEVSGAGGAGNWEDRSFKLNGRYGSCKTAAAYANIDTSKSKVI